MDPLDVQILRTLGVKPFTARPRRTEGLKPSSVARTLGRNVELVKDRLERLETAGVIARYRIFPNLGQCGLGLASFHFLADTIPDRDRLARLADVDGLVGVLWFYGGDLCVDLSFGSEPERARRVALVAELIGAQRGPLPLYDRPFPAVARPLAPLDWRIIRALWDDARRPLPEVAAEVGVTVKTVRARLQSMRREGSIDEHVELDYERMTGLIPFNLAAWIQPGHEASAPRRLEALHEGLLIRFPPPQERGAPAWMAQLVARSPAEIENVLRQAKEVEGVANAATLIPTGGYYTDAWLSEIIDARAEAEPRRVPKSSLVSPRREIRS